MVPLNRAPLRRPLMRPLIALTVALALVEVGAVVTSSSASALEPPPQPPAAPQHTTANPATTWTPPPEPVLRPVVATACPARPTTGTATCLTDVHGTVSDQSAAVAGKADAAATSDTDTAPLPDEAVPQAVTKTGSYTPADLASLYRIPAGLSATATIGIVDVGSDPNTQAQLSYYRSYFGLPPCTGTNGCFREVGQDGTAHLPATDSGWVTEIAMDVQAVSAVCATCHILLVDANSAAAGDLGAAAATAVRLGASYVSMSYGSSVGSQDAALNLSYYNTPGVTYVAASGDSGYAGGPIFPSAATNVVAVGGTSAALVNGTWRQTAWSDAGSGCATTGLLGVVTGLVQSLLSGSACPHGRAVTDVSALADPSTGLMFYRGGQWWSGGGTSLAAPIVTALYALAGNHSDPLAIYANVSDRPSAFVDITTGSNGSCGTVLCAATTGWDGPTGIGTPSGLDGLQSDGATPLPLAAPTTAGALSRSGGYPARLHYRLADATTGAPVPGATVLVQADTGHGFVHLGMASTDADSTLSYAVRPHGPASYRVVFAGDATHGASTSPAVRVATFAPRVAGHLTGRRLQVRATAPWQAPAAGLAVTVQRREGSAWRAVVRRTTSSRGLVAVRCHRGALYRVAYGGGEWTAGHTRTFRVRG